MRIYQDAIEAEFEKISDLYEKMFESERKVIMTRRLYQFMQRTALNDEFEQWPNGNEYAYYYREAMDWNVDGYMDHNLEGMPDTTISGYKIDLKR